MAGNVTWMLLPSLYSFVRSNYDIRDEKAWLYVRIRVSIEEKEKRFFHIPGGYPRSQKSHCQIFEIWHVHYDQGPYLTRFQWKNLKTNGGEKMAKPAHLLYFQIVKEGKMKYETWTWIFICSYYISNAKVL